MKDIIGYDGYQVDKTGRVYGPRGELAQWISDSGYMKVGLFKEGRRRRIRVHRLVANAYLPNEDRKPCVNHKNGDKTDNRVENLEWVTHEENARHAAENNLTSKGPVEIKAISLNGKGEKRFPSIAKAARDLGITYTQARACLTGAKASAHGYRLEKIKNDA